MDGGPLLLQPALKVKVWVIHDSATVAAGPLAGPQVVTGFMRNGVAGG